MGMGAIVDCSSVVEFGKFIAEETEKWATAIKFAGIKAERVKQCRPDSRVGPCCGPRR
jgi:hypothetical protein